MQNELNILPALFREVNFFVLTTKFCMSKIIEKKVAHLSDSLQKMYLHNVIFSFCIK